MWSADSLNCKFPGVAAIRISKSHSITVFRGQCGIAQRFERFQTIAQLDLKTLSERKVVGPHARVEELDQEGPIDNRSRLSDELIQTRILHCPESHCVHIGAVAVAGRRAIERHLKADRMPR